MSDIFEIYSEIDRQIMHELLSEDQNIISAFKAFSRDFGLTLKDENFYSSFKIGTIAKYSNLLFVLCPNLNLDKDGLVSLKEIPKEFVINQKNLGLLKGHSYQLMFDNYFRKDFFELNLYNIELIKLLTINQENQLDISVAIDKDRVCLNIDKFNYIEKDIYYGPKFTLNIEDIKDDNVVLGFRIDIEDLGESGSFFDFNYRVNIKWETNNKIKSFYAYEFKTSNVQLICKDKIFYPVKYVHAEFDLESKTFRHLDGSIHFYSKEDYEQRRNDNFNFNNKNTKLLKADSRKLFKVNGCISVELWSQIVGYFFLGNPLIYEYFEGKIPVKVDKLIDIFINNQNQESLKS
jgi:hypothetical protein